MKKTIKILLEKMEDLKEKEDGKLQGGFASIKGGFTAAEFGTNDWPSSCTNTKNCIPSTNTGQGCYNTGYCFT